MTVFWLMVAAPIVVLSVLSCYGLWIFGGYLCDKYDQWRTDNWKGW